MNLDPGGEESVVRSEPGTSRIRHSGRRASRVWKPAACPLGPAFTVFEVLVALCLAILLVSALAVFYSGALTSRERGSKLAAEAIQTRTMLNRIAEELRQAVPLVPGDGKGFQGTADSITNVRTRLPAKSTFQEYSAFDTLPPAQPALMRVTYHLYWDEEERKDDEGIIICYGVWRTEQTTFDPNPKLVVVNKGPEDEEGEEVVEVPQPVGELYAPEIKFLRFEYYDGIKWRDRWNMPATSGDSGDSGGGSDSTGESTADSAQTPNGTCVLPQAVRITMGRVRQTPDEQALDISQLKEEREERERRELHSDRFTMAVYLPQSDQSLLSSRKKGSKDDKDALGEQTSGGT